jgi:hypothetical protein
LCPVGGTSTLKLEKKKKIKRQDTTPAQHQKQSSSETSAAKVSGVAQVHTNRHVVLHGATTTHEDFPKLCVDFVDIMAPDHRGVAEERPI